MNQTKFCKFIAGTIFIAKSDAFTENEVYTNIIKNIEYKENFKYYSNFDHNGTIFRYTNAGEYIVQGLIYKNNYKCGGIEIDEFISHATYLKYLNFNLLEYKNNKKNILFISNELSKTGAPLVMKNIINLVKDKFNVYVLSLFGGDDIRFYKNNFNTHVIYKEHVRYNFNNLKYLSKLVNNMTNQIDFDIVYCSTLVSIFGIYGAYNKKRNIILHIHEANNEIINLYNKNMIIGFDFIKYCNSVISVNDFLTNFYKKQKYDNMITNFSTIYNDIAIELNDTDILKKYNLEHLKNKILIGGVGSICYRKGFDIFIEVCLKYPQYNFIWASNNTLEKAKCFIDNDLPKNFYLVNLDKKKIWVIFIKF